MKVLVATDSYKNSVRADLACAAIARGWRSQRPHDEVITLPQADGGEGTTEAVRRAIPGSDLVDVGPVTGPAGRPVPGQWLRLPDGTALIELASVSGLELMPELDPMNATTRGLGEVIAHAVRADARRLVVALGGSASTDGGAGALDAIGELAPPAGGVTLLTDVTNPLLGPMGAARVFGPQKGATPAQVTELERRLEAFAAAVGADPTTPGVGAAGGTAYGLSAWGGVIQPGATFISELTGLTAEAATADLVITGEGRFDAQSLAGKVVGTALTLPTPVAVIAGRIEHRVDAWSTSLMQLAGSVQAAMSNSEHWLEVAGARAARAHAPLWRASEPIPVSPRSSALSSTARAD